jgi:segregation and condensation protein B
MNAPSPWRHVSSVPADWKRWQGRLQQLVDFLPTHRHQSNFPSSIQSATLRDETVARVEAVLFSSREPISLRRLAKLAMLDSVDQVRPALERLSNLLREGKSAFQLEEIAGGYQLLTRPDLRPSLERVCQIRHGAPVSGPTLETLAIVAYRQPICRADVEAIRGVQVGEILRHLLDEGLIRLVGKDDSLGRPFLYGTTPKFLQVFGLRHLHELPMVESLAKPAGKIAQPIAATHDDDAPLEQATDDDT